MSRLALTLPVSPRETPTSYLSRLAARNFSEDLHSFCLDTGIDLVALATGDKETVEQVIRLAGLADGSFARTTIVKTSTMKYRVGDEVMNTETLGRGEIRHCPACIAEDRKGGAPIWGAIHPLHWQVIPIRCCTRHDVPLASYRPPFDGCLKRFDFTGNLHFLMSNPVAPGPGADAVDHYLTRRVYGEHGESWCNRLEIPALVKACEAFGVLIDHGRDARAASLSAEIRRDAMLTGFRILDGGPDGICAALDAFNRSTPPRGGNQPHPSNGELQRMLGSHRKMRRDLDPLRDIVRAYFIETYPYSPGSEVFGQKITERRVYSLHGACRAIPIRRSVLEEMLITRGCARRDADGRFRLDAILTVALVAELRAEKDTYLDQQQTADHLGCSFAMFKQLQRSGLLRPADGAGHWARKGFRRDHLDAFLTVVFQGAERFRKPPPGTARLDLATRKAICSVPDILRLILDGKLTAAGRLSNDLKLGTLLVRTDDLLTAFPATEPNGYTFSQACKMMKLNLPSLRRLIELGYLSARRMKHNQSRVTNDLITVASMRTFRAEYCTIGMINHRRNGAPKLTLSDMEAAGVPPVLSEPGIRRVFRWRDMPTGMMPEPIGATEGSPPDRVSSVVSAW